MIIALLAIFAAVSQGVQVIKPFVQFSKKQSSYYTDDVTEIDYADLSRREALQMVKALGSDLEELDKAMYLIEEYCMDGDDSDDDDSDDVARGYWYGRRRGYWGRRRWGHYWGRRRGYWGRRRSPKAFQLSFTQSQTSKVNMIKPRSMTKRGLIRKAKMLVEAVKEKEEEVMDGVEACGGKRKFMKIQLAAEVEELTDEVDDLMDELKEKREDCQYGAGRRRSPLAFSSSIATFQKAAAFQRAASSYERSEKPDTDPMEMSRRELKAAKKALTRKKKKKMKAIKDFVCKK